MVDLTIRLLFIMTFVLGLPFFMKAWGQAITIEVNSTGDLSDANGGIDNTCDDGTGHCTLRAAIETHNQHAGFQIINTIRFNVPMPAVIRITRALQFISGQLHIDGTTQPGYAANDNKPIIEIDGSGAGGSDGFTIVGDCTVEGLCIHSFGGRAILIRATGGVADNNVVRYNFIGTDPTGTIDKGNALGGIRISASFSAINNLIRSNLISANGGPGVEIDGGGSTGFTLASNNIIDTNRIGVDITGTQALPNDGEGILIHNGAKANVIDANQISGNFMDGVRISGATTDNNIVRRNFIGTNARGDLPLPNSNNGVKIESGAMANEIWGGNVLSGNTQNGVLITGGGTDNNLVLQNNRIGSNFLIDGGLPNGMNGVMIDSGAKSNVIGELASFSNAISGNNENGVYITGLGTDDNIVIGNLIGLDQDGLLAVPNGKNGVAIDFGAQVNVIGQDGGGNLISGNTANGVLISGEGTEGNVVTFNKIGTDVSGNAPQSNENGVVLELGAKLNDIGQANAKNLISGNDNNGVLITGLGTDNNHVLSNDIGLNAAGTAPLPNGLNGVSIEAGATLNEIGASGASNVISGNTQNGVLISGLGTDNNILSANSIGTTADTKTPLPNGTNGVAITDGAKLNEIGGAFKGNVISGNTGNGVLMTGTGTTGNMVISNLIGCDITGTEPVPNVKNGVSIESGAQLNEIKISNTISGNLENGVQITGASTERNFLGTNYIGLNATGDAKLPNNKNGVAIFLGAQFNEIGRVNNINVISANIENGVLISSGSNNNSVIGNHIGTDLGGDALLPNGKNGVSIEGASTFNTIGGIRGEEGNRISGNIENGVLISGPGTNQNIVDGNNIGFNNKTPASALPNKNGISILFGAQFNKIGTSNERGNCIAGNTETGVLISGTGTDANLVLHNFVGFTFIEFGEETKLPNKNGVVIGQSATQNAIGGVGIGNTISGNSMNGVLITTGAFENSILANNIGTNRAATGALPNLNGVLIESGANKNQIGGFFSQNQGNLISGNLENGVWINGAGADNNLVQGNIIGPNMDGTAVFVNGSNRNGVVIGGQAKLNRVGGFDPDEGNLISGNIFDGVVISDAGTDNNEIWANKIGTTLNGHNILSNGVNGVEILLGAKLNEIGGFLEAQGNLISGNLKNGVEIFGEGTDNNRLEHNKIGTDIDGNKGLPNQVGVALTGNASREKNTIVNNLIKGNTNNDLQPNNFFVTNVSEVTPSPAILQATQGTGILLDGNSDGLIDGNTITDCSVGILIADVATATITSNILSANGLAIVLEGTGTGIFLSRNSIFNNAQLGIDLGNDGVTPNHAGSVTGPNNFQNFPVLTAVSFNGGNITIAGTLNSTANNRFNLEFFANNTCHPTGFGEGQTFLGSQQVNTDGNGNAAFSVTFTGQTVPAGSAITATASDSANNTSEFGACFSTGPSPSADLELTKESDTSQANIGDQVTFTLTLSNKGPAQATGISVTDSLPAGISFDQATTSVGSYDNNTGIWSVEALSSGSQATLAIKGTTTQAGTLTNIAEVTASNETDPDSSPENGVATEDDQDSVSIDVVQPLLADLELIKQADTTQAVVGDQVSYTLTLVNNGPGQATGIAVTDILPVGFSFNQANASLGSYENNTGVWSIGTLSNGGQATLTINGTLNQAGTITNTAEVTASNQTDPDSSPGNDIATEDDQSSVSVQVAPEISIVDQINQLMQQVNGLVLQNQLSSWQGRSLNSLLAIAIAEIRKGMATNQVCRGDKNAILSLEIFILEVRLFMRISRLSNENGHMLIDAARKIIKQLKHEVDNENCHQNNQQNVEYSKVKNLPGDRLNGNYPNPFTNATRISFELANQGRVQLTIYDAAGRINISLLNKVLPAGKHSMEWRPGNLATGVYFLRMSKGDFIRTQHMLFVK